MPGNNDNLKPPRSTEEARERGRKGGISSGKARREKKLMSQIYAEFLIKEHDVVGKDGLKKKLSGDKLLSSVMSKILSRGDSSSVALMREIRQATEGENLNLSGSVNLSKFDLSKLTDEELDQLEALQIKMIKEEEAK